MFEQDVTTTKYQVGMPGASSVSLIELVESLRQPVSRFKKPGSRVEKLLLSILLYPLRRGVLSTVRVPVTSSTPLPWQPIFNFLYQQKLLERPGFSLTTYRNDKPKALSISITGTPRIHDAAALAEVAQGHASGGDFDETLSKALGEFLERYAACMYDQKQSIRASIAELQKKRVHFLDPSDLNQFSKEQHERKQAFRYSKDTSFQWLRNAELTSGKTYLVPAQLVYYHFRHASSGEPILNPLTSNGMAGHFTAAEATIAGLKELVQRDAFLIYWLNTLTPKRIRVADIEDAEFKNIEAYARRYNIKLHFLDLHTDIPVPTVLCVAIGEENGTPIITVGAGNGGSALDAILRSYYEAITAQSLDRERALDIDFSGKTYVPFSNHQIGKLDRIVLWRGKEWLERIGFLLNGSYESYDAFKAKFHAHPTPQAELEQLVHIFKQYGKGYEIYTFEMENPILEKLGYHVVQVRVPKLVPMYLYEDEVTLDAERLESVPRKLGFATVHRNMYPHPFP